MQLSMDTKKFEGGAQGEHKLSRGLEGVETNSAHWLAHPQFSDAVGNFFGSRRCRDWRISRESNYPDTIQDSIIHFQLRID